MSKKGREGFEEFYSTVYAERWPTLRSALESPVRQVARRNRFFESRVASSRGDAGLNRSYVTIAGQQCLPIAEGESIDGAQDTRGTFEHYVMDPASIYAAVALDVQPGDDVLDMCAAPGGKSLVLAERLAESGTLICNEISDRRRARLRAVLEDYLPKDMLASRVRVTGHDAGRWCLHETSAFDRVLLDAPCSGERHLLSDPAEMKVWSQARSKNLAVRQYALLASSLQVVRVGGRIVYSTCSLSPLENDAVIARLLKRRVGEARVVRDRWDIGEPTEFGWVILPDVTGQGPIYFAVLEREAIPSVSK